MSLLQLTKGKQLTIFEEIHNRAVSEEYEAIVRQHKDERLVVVSCPWLHANYERLNLGSQLNVGFEIDDVAYSFIAVAKSKLRGGNQVVLEQLTDIETLEKRKFNRDELRVDVAIYGLPKSKVSSSSFNRPEVAPDLVDASFDLSSGGLCIITDTLLSSKHDPYYLLEFSLTAKDTFRLPARLVRRSNYPRTKVGKYDYGFQFFYDALPEEKGRLTTAILNKKISGS